MENIKVCLVFISIG